MKRFEIFKPGRHTAANGATLDFSDDVLARSASAYDPAIHEAPIVVGHPRDNAPAYGWVKSINFAEGSVTVEPDQVDADFEEMVAAGRFKKRSASWYLPGSAGHPLKGTPNHDTYYLRHVGFLGAMPPAVKGLKEVNFNEAEGFVEFSDSVERWGWAAMASIVRGLREWIVAENGVEAADKVLPQWHVKEIETTAEKLLTAPQDNQAGMNPVFNEEDPMTIAELQAQVAALTAQNATLKANQKPADFGEREASIAAREAKVAEIEARAARSGVESRVDAAIKDGRILPAQKKHAIDFAMSLTDGEATIEFGEGDKAKKVSQREAYLMQVETGPKVIDFRELSGENGQRSDTGSEAEALAKINAQVLGGQK